LFFAAEGSLEGGARLREAGAIQLGHLRLVVSAHADASVVPGAEWDREVMPKSSAAGRQVLYLGVDVGAVLQAAHNAAGTGQLVEPLFLCRRRCLH
jgi:hypothetical protein